MGQLLYKQYLISTFKEGVLKFSIWSWTVTSTCGEYPSPVNSEHRGREWTGVPAVVQNHLAFNFILKCNNYITDNPEGKNEWSRDHNHSLFRGVGGSAIAILPPPSLGGRSCVLVPVCTGNEWPLIITQSCQPVILFRGNNRNLE